MLERLLYDTLCQWLKWEIQWKTRNCKLDKIENYWCQSVKFCLKCNFVVEESLNGRKRGKNPLKKIENEAKNLS